MKFIKNKTSLFLNREAKQRKTINKIRNWENKRLIFFQTENLNREKQ